MAGGETITQSLLEEKREEIEDEDWEGKWNKGVLNMMRDKLVTLSQKMKLSKKKQTYLNLWHHLRSQVPIRNTK